MGHWLRMPENPYKSPEAEGNAGVRRRFALRHLLASLAALPFIGISAYCFYCAWWCYIQPFGSGYKDHPYVQGYSTAGIFFASLSLITYLFAVIALKHLLPPAPH